MKVHTVILICNQSKCNVRLKETFSISTFTLSNGLIIFDIEGRRNDKVQS